MQCSSCGERNDPIRGFCGACGTPLPVLCTDCGFLNQREARFCGGCARPLGPPSLGVARQFQRATEYTPRHLATRILQSRPTIEGERKLITVMFVDIRDSFSMIAGADPEHAQSVLDSLLKVMIDSVHRYEGTVNQVLGDGIMALFGAPIAHEDHVVRAASAALVMQETVRKSPDEAWQGLSGPARLRIGLSSGEVVISGIRNDLSMDYRAVGPTTHMASRMEQIAQPGAILMTGETLRLGEGLLDVDALGRMEIKGIPEPVDVFALKGIHSQRTRFAARIASGASPLVGRETAMRRLEGLLGEVCAGTHQVVILDGEPGVGKSRLWYELVRSKPGEDCLVLEAATASYLSDTPFAAVASCLRRFFGIKQSDTADEVRDLVTQRMTEVSSLLSVFAPAVLSVLDVPSADEEWRALDPVQKRQRRFEALTRLLACLCERQPVILLWEDLQWFDGESLALLNAIIETPPAGPLLLALTHRPGFSRSWLGLPGQIPLRIDPLPPDSAEQLVAELVGADRELAKLRATVSEQTSGNPFFIEECVRALVDSSVLEGEPGSYRLAVSDPKIEIPPTVEALITARIDRLDPEVKEFIQVVAVIGNEAPIELMRRVTGLPEDVFHAHLDVAKEKAILVESQLFPSPIYRFPHSLLHEVVYRSLIRSHRVSHHARVVEAMEELYAERIREWVDRLSQHARDGELWEKAVHYHYLASERAATRWANRKAVDLIDRGLEMLERIPEGRARSEAAIDLRLSAQGPLLPLGEKQRMLRMLDEAETMATAINDQRRLGAIFTQLAAALWLIGEQDRARITGERALAIARAIGEPALEAAARFNLGMVHHALANFDQAIEIQRGFLKQLSGGLERRRMGWSSYPSVACRTFLGSSLVYVGEFDEALSHLERGCEIADELDHPYSRALVRDPLGFYYLTRGRLQEALETFELAMRIAHENEVITMYPASVGRVAMTLAELGRHQEAIEITEDALDRGLQRLGGGYAHRYILAGAAAGYAGVGRYEKALARACELEEATAASGERALHAETLMLLGDIHTRRGEVFSEAAERAYRAALDICEERGMRPALARCCCSLGTLLQASRRRDDAAELLLRARDLYTAIGMGEAAERAEKLASGS